MTTAFANYDIQPVRQLLLASGVDNASATVNAIAAPGATKALAIHFIKVATKTADDITTQESGGTLRDRDYLPATGQSNKILRDAPLILAANMGLTFIKGTAGTNFSYFVQYQIIDLAIDTLNV